MDNGGVKVLFGNARALAVIARERGNEELAKELDACGGECVRLDNGKLIGIVEFEDDDDR